MPGCRAGLTADEKEQPAEVVCSVDQWFSNRVPSHQCHLDTCQKCTFSNSIPKPLNRKLWGGSPRIYALTSTLDDSGPTEAGDAQIWS